MSVVQLTATAWGDVAAERIGPHWLGRLWEHDVQGLVLVDESDGTAVHLIEPTGTQTPLAIVVPGISAIPSQSASFAWRVGPMLWLGDDAMVALPTVEPQPSAFDWRRAAETMDEPTLARHLARLADWFLARVPEATLGDLFAEHLAVAPLDRRRDLTGEARLFRWRAARYMETLIPSLARGALAEVESTIGSVAGLGTGLPPEGSHFVLGLVAGLRLWPRFLDQSSGLNERPLTARLVASAGPHAGRLGRDVLDAANRGRWGPPWIKLGQALGARGPYPDWAYEQLEAQALGWLNTTPHEASAGLSGLLLPFLLTQQGDDNVA